jgi:hypothetical protein
MFVQVRAKSSFFVIGLLSLDNGKKFLFILTAVWKQEGCRLARVGQ